MRAVLRLRGRTGRALTAGLGVNVVGSSRYFTSSSLEDGPSRSTVASLGESPPSSRKSVEALAAEVDGSILNVHEFLALQEMDREKRISETQRALRSAYKEGDSVSALEGARQLKEMCAVHFTRDHPAYASALNDLALMQKENGEYSFSVESYLEALRVYQKVFGVETHPSFATALANCGLAFRAYAATASSLEKSNLLLRAKEHLERAVELRTEILGEGHPERELSVSHLAGIHAELGETEKGEKMMRDVIDRLKKSEGKTPHLSIATVVNNLALMLKKQKRYSEALPLYRSALMTRTAHCGPSHPTTIAVRNNLAECLDESGDQQGAKREREAILASLGQG